MTTPLANPHYLPEVCIKVTLVNFTVTGPGLEEQLLAELVRKERPDLQASKDRLLLSISNDKRQLKVTPHTLPHVTASHLTIPHVTAHRFTVPHATVAHVILPHITIPPVLCLKMQLSAKCGMIGSSGRTAVLYVVQDVVW